MELHILSLGFLGPKRGILQTLEVSASNQNFRHRTIHCASTNVQGFKENSKSLFIQYKWNNIKTKLYLRSNKISKEKHKQIHRYLAFIYIYVVSIHGIQVVSTWKKHLLAALVWHSELHRNMKQTWISS